MQSVCMVLSIKKKLHTWHCISIIKGNSLWIIKGMSTVLMVGFNAHHFLMVINIGPNKNMFVITVMLCFKKFGNINGEFLTWSIYIKLNKNIYGLLELKILDEKILHYISGKCHKRQQWAVYSQNWRHWKIICILLHLSAQDSCSKMISLAIDKLSISDAHTSTFHFYYKHQGSKKCIEG